ncbi:MAG: spore gernimation protein [Clostridiales bacterium GWB2_37_7]|nr:MAG: spore gernimation protein [Clostridiales bacterium GWB2_37_7]
MRKEIITQKQGIVIMIGFILGSSLVFGGSSEAKQDVWISILVAMLMAVPTFFIYARLLSIFPGKSLFEILDAVFGKVVGKILALPFIWFALYLGSLVIRDFSEFIHHVSPPGTPQFSIGIPIIFLCIWAARAGIEVIGRWTSITFPVAVIFLLIIILLLSPLFEFKNMKPVLYNGFSPVLDAGYLIFTFPFAETVIFMAVLNCLQSKGSVYKVYYWSLLISGTLILIVAVSNVLALGVANTSIMLFTTFHSVRLISIGFVERIEAIVSALIIFSGFVKISICLYAASKGIAKVLNINNYKQTVVPVGILMMILSVIIFRNTMEWYEFTTKTYKIYAIPFEIILPLVILIVAEIKILLKKKGAIR